MGRPAPATWCPGGASATGKERSVIGSGDDLTPCSAIPPCAASGLRRASVPAQSFLDVRDQLSAVKGLHQEGGRSSRLRSPFELRLGIRSNDDGRNAVTFRPEPVLKIETAHSRQLDIRDEARGPCRIARLQEGLRGGECKSGEAQGRDEIFRGDTDGFIVVHDRNDWSFGQCDHTSCERGRATHAGDDIGIVSLRPAATG